MAKASTAPMESDVCAARLLGELEIAASKKDAVEALAIAERVADLGLSRSHRVSPMFPGQRAEQRGNGCTTAQPIKGNGCPDSTARAPSPYDDGKFYGIKMLSKFGGRCAVCGASIGVTQPCLWSKSRKAICCPDCGVVE